MWEAIGNIFTSANGVTVGVLILIIIALVFICARLGIVKIKTDKLSVGMNAGEVERTIIRNQIGWVKKACRAFEGQVPQPEGYNQYRTKFILEILLDEIIEWIIFNHIEDKKTYIEIKQDIIWNIVLANVDKKEMRSEKFHKAINEYVEKVIKGLVAVREEYD